MTARASDTTPEFGGPMTAFQLFSNFVIYQCINLLATEPSRIMNIRFELCNIIENPKCGMGQIRECFSLDPIATLMVVRDPHQAIRGQSPS
jgi:hypothetical protein